MYDGYGAATSLAISRGQVAYKGCHEIGVCLQHLHDNAWIIAGKSCQEIFVDDDYAINEAEASGESYHEIAGDDRDIFLELICG